MKEFLLRKYVKFWYWKFKLKIKNWRDSELYTSGQFDEFPREEFLTVVSIFTPEKDFWKNHWQEVLARLMQGIGQGIIIYIVVEILKGAP